MVGVTVGDGASGVLVAGSTGEGTLLAPDQRVALTRAAAAVLPAGGVLLAGASGPTPAALDEDVAALAAAGADAVLVLAPHTYPLSPQELCDLHLEVAERATVPTLAYHIPQLTGSSLTPDTVRELAVHPGIIGMKDSSPDADRRAEFAAATCDVEDFTLVTGHASSLARALDDGVGGAILAIANLRMRAVAALLQAHAAGDGDAVARHQATLARAAEALAGVPGSTPAVLKAALQLQGLLTERWCRPPLRSLDARQLDHVRTALLR